MGVQVNFELNGELAEHVAAVTDGSGSYANIEEYLRDLIRKDADKEYADLEAFRAELQSAFAAPEEEYVTITAAEVIERNRLRRAG